MDDQKPLSQRLGSEQFDPRDVIRALRGKKLPEHLGYPLIKLCTIRGILHSASFAEGEAAPLRGLPEHPEFTRALNSRAIMSNHMPDMDPKERPEEVPYCIWYPEVASEDTYRQLSKRYPQMRHQVARACAVAGYTDLYLELEDVLPEVAVAEEARAAGSTAIFNHIMAQPVRYKVFDDHYRTINLETPQTAPLNGDTFVLSMVERQKQTFKKPWNPNDDDFLPRWMGLGFREMMCNITEDQGIAEMALDEDDAPALSSADLMMDLLTSPLPANLPAGNKDLLILAAAYYGDIDRYMRLRRPKALRDELFCVVRGIYHNPLFALMWEHQRNPPEGEPFHMPEWEYIEKAITARHIMNNDLSRVIAKKDGKDCLPYLIWYPESAQMDTYRALAQKVPEMRESCIRAAIYCQNVELFDELMALPDTVPNLYLANEAELVKNTYFLSTLQSRAEALGISLDSSNLEGKRYEPWKKLTVKGSGIVMSKWNWLPRSPRVGLVNGEFEEQGALYNGVRASAQQLELWLMVPESWRPRTHTAWTWTTKDGHQAGRECHVLRHMSRHLDLLREQTVMNTLYITGLFDP